MLHNVYIMCITANNPPTFWTIPLPNHCLHLRFHSVPPGPNEVIVIVTECFLCCDFHDHIERYSPSVDWLQFGHHLIAYNPVVPYCLTSSCGDRRPVERLRTATVVRGYFDYCCQCSYSDRMIVDAEPSEVILIVSAGDTKEIDDGVVDAKPKMMRRTAQCCHCYQHPLVCW